MSLDAVERQRMPFVGETGGGLGQGEAAPADRPTSRRPTERRIAPPIAAACRPTRPSPTAWPRPRRADAHRDHEERRAPRPDRMQR